MMLNGPAARLAYKGDTIIVIAYAPMDDAEAKGFQATVVKVDANGLIPLPIGIAADVRVGDPVVVEGPREPVVLLGALPDV